MTDLVQKAKLTELEHKIPDISSLARKTALEIKIPSVSSLVKKQAITQNLVILKKHLLIMIMINMLLF